MAAYDAGSIEADLTLDRSAFQAGLRAARAEAARFDGKRIGPRLDLKGAAQAERQLRSLSSQLSQMGRKRATPVVNLRDIREQRRELSALNRQISALQRRRVNIPVDADTARAQSKIRQLRGRDVQVGVDADTGAAQSKLAGLSRPRRATVNVDADTAGAAAKLETFRIAQGARGILIPVAISLSPALVPILATATGAVAGLGAAFAAAGAGAGAFGVAAVGSISKLVKHNRELKTAQEAVKTAQENLNQARKSGDAAAVKAAQQQLTAAKQTVQQLRGELSPALQSVQDEWTQTTSAFSKFSKKLEPMFARVGVPVLDAVQAGLKAVTPLAIAGGAALGRLADKVRDGLASPAFANWINQIKGPAATALEGFGNSVINLAKGLGNLMVAFAPLGTSMVSGLESLTAKFAAWSASVSKTEGFRKFIDYVRDKGPLVLSTLGDIANVMIDLAVAAAPVGEVILKLVGGLARLVSRLLEVNPTLSSIVVGLGAGLLAWNALAKGILAAVAALTRWKTAVNLMSFGLLFRNTAKTAAATTALGAAAGTSAKNVAANTAASTAAGAAAGTATSRFSKFASVLGKIKSFGRVGGVVGLVGTGVVTLMSAIQKELNAADSAAARLQDKMKWFSRAKLPDMGPGVARARARAVPAWAQMSPMPQNVVNTWLSGHRAIQGAIRQTANQLQAAANSADALNRRGAFLNFKGAALAAKQQVDQFGNSLNVNTQKGLANQQMLQQLASAAQAMGGTIAQQRARFMQAASAAGFTDKQVRRLADALFALPGQTTVKVKADGVSNTKKGLGDVGRELRGLAGTTVAPKIRTPGLSNAKQGTRQWAQDLGDLPGLVNVRHRAPGQGPAKQGTHQWAADLGDLPGLVNVRHRAPGQRSAKEGTKQWVTTLGDLPGVVTVRHRAPGQGPSRQGTRLWGADLGDLPGLVNVRHRAPGLPGVRGQTRGYKGDIDAVPGSKNVNHRTPGLSGARSQTQGYRGDVNRVPGSKSVSFPVPGLGGVRVQVQGLRGDINSIPPSKTITFHVNRVVNVAKNIGKLGLASGGQVRGPGGPRDDLIPAMLSNREYVTNAAAADYYGTRFMDAINERRIPRDALPRFADGGPVTIAHQVVRRYQDGGVVGGDGAFAVPIGEWWDAFRGHTTGRKGLRRARREEQKATEALRKAERALRKERHDGDDNRKQLARAEDQVAAARKRLRKETEQLDQAEQGRRLAKLPAAEQMTRAVGAGVTKNATFLAALTKLAGRGQYGIAAQLAQMGPEKAGLAKKIAGASGAKLAKLAGKVKTASRQQAMIENLPGILAITEALKKMTRPSVADIAGRYHLEPDAVAAAGKLITARIRKAGANGALLLAQVTGKASGVPGLSQEDVFDSGGLATQAGLLYKRTIAPERVLSPRQTDLFERMIHALERYGTVEHDSHGGCVINLNHVPGRPTPAELVDALRAHELQRSARWRR